MRSEYRRDAIVATLPVAGERHAFLERVCGVFRIRAALIDNGRGDQCSHSAGFDHLGDDVGIVVHVDEGRSAAANHLPTGKLGTDTHELRVHELHFRGKNVIGQPVEKSEIIGDTAKQGHRRMRMSVDEPRHDDVVVASKMTVCRVLRIDVIGRTHRDDQAAVNSNGAVGDHVTVAIHRDDVIALDNEIDRVVIC